MCTLGYVFILIPAVGFSIGVWTTMFVGAIERTKLRYAQEWHVFNLAAIDQLKSIKGDN